MRPHYCMKNSSRQNEKNRVKWEHGFRALIYMHRYQSDTIARIRTDYVHEQQARYRTVIADQMISINLDDGVKKNYAIFQDVLAKIK